MNSHSPRPARAAVALGALIIVAAASCAAASGPVAPGPLYEPPTHSVVAFTGVRLVSMTDSRVLDGQTVLIAGDRIEAVGPDASVPVPDSATVIAGNGRYLMPGLADMHVHMIQAELHVYAESGVTTVRNMWGYPGLLTFEHRADGGLVADSLTPTIYSASPGVDAPPGQWPYTQFITDPAAADTLIGRLAGEGWRFIKVYTSLSLPVYDAVMAAARKHHIRALGHVPWSVSLQHALDEGQYSIEHLMGYDVLLTGGQHGALAWAHADLSGAAHLAQLTRDAGTWVCPTSVVLGRILKNSQVDAATQAAAAANRHGMIRALHEAGARLLVGTDAGIQITAAGTSLHDELDEFVASGFTPYEALHAATVEAAEFLGLSGEFGTITPGLRADLLLLDANPLDNVDNARAPAGVMVRGRWFVRGR